LTLIFLGEKENSHDVPPWTCDVCLMGPVERKLINTVSEIKIMNGFFLEKMLSGSLFMLSLLCLLKTVR
jgi:hypothetical protein